ncbi:MAG: C-terminal binding protein [Chloroflexi bacterium]|nr:C-terminal binding protein [Chloroflexota bacterium]
MAFTVVRGLLGRGDDESALDFERRTLAEVGAEIVPVPVADREQVMALLPRADGLFAFSTITADMIARLERCRAAVTMSHGYNGVDLEAATTAGIPVSNLYFCHREVANHTLMFLLASTRKLVMLHNALKEGRWERERQPPVPPLYGQTMGLIGLGHIGREVARRVQAMDMQVLAFDPIVSRERAAELGVELVDLDDLLRRADFVSLHVPSSPSTVRILNERTLGLLKPTAWVINTARGDLIDEAALYRVLAEKRIAGAALDVFEVEPTPPENPILRLDNVLVTPHAAGYSDEALNEGRRQGAREMARVVQGYLPSNICNPEVRGRTRFAFKD